MIENFATLSQEELVEFAKNLLDKVNEKNIFDTHLTDEFTCSFTDDVVYANDMTGNLHIGVDIPTLGMASITNGDYWDYPEYDTPEVERNFGKKEAIIDGYKLTLELYDVYEDGYEEIDGEDVNVPMIVEASIIVEPAPKQ